MARKTIWELLKNEDVDDDKLDLLLKRIHNFTKTKNCFSSFTVIYGYESIYSFLIDIYNKYEDETIDSFLYSFEILITLLNFMHSEGKKRKFTYSENIFYTELILYIKQFIYFVDKLNYSYKCNENTNECIVFTKDSVVESVAYNYAVLGDENTSWRLLSYYSVNSTIEDKIDTIRFLFTHLEKLKRNKPNGYDKASRLANYFRHDQDLKGKIVTEIEENKELYCDLTFNLLLECFLSDFNRQNLKKHKEIIDKIT